MIGSMAEAPSQQELEALNCWEPEDRVPARPAMTEFRRRLRRHQALWREANGHPIGSHPIVPRSEKPSRPVGSRLPLDYARKTGASFLTSGARDAARTRTSFVEPHQSFDHQRFWADLLWSPALAFNLFGDLAADLDLADRAVRALWPETPGVVREVRFEHSPGRLDPTYLNSLRAFDAAFVLELADGTNGILAVDTKYHEWAKPETPKPSNRARNLEVADRSRVFAPGATDALVGRSELCLTWLEHLLLLSMLQHASGAWTWGRYVVVHPAGNSDVVAACDRYRALLVDESTFSSVTLEKVLGTRALPASTVDALQDRYVPRD
jgi:PD-(D/E)XK nuclease superfamily protein